MSPMIAGAMHERPRLIRSKRDNCGHREQADEGNTHRPNNITGRRRHSCHKELLDLTVQMLVDRRKTWGMCSETVAFYDTVAIEILSTTTSTRTAKKE